LKLVVLTTEHRVSPPAVIAVAIFGGIIGDSIRYSIACRHSQPTIRNVRHRGGLEQLVWPAWVRKSLHFKQARSIVSGVG
jgi:membrane protein DedA with SNARE-associated domain